jgi:hypothetical protein
MTEQEAKECELLLRQWSRLRRRAQAETDPEQLVRILNHMTMKLQAIKRMVLDKSIQTTGGVRPQIGPADSAEIGSD